MCGCECVCVCVCVWRGVAVVWGTMWLVCGNKLRAKWKSVVSSGDAARAQTAGREREDERKEPEESKTRQEAKNRALHLAISSPISIRMSSIFRRTALIHRSPRVVRRALRAHRVRHGSALSIGAVRCENAKELAIRAYGWYQTDDFSPSSTHRLTVEYF